MASLGKGIDGELIRDREVSVVDEDRLGHDSVVEQLEHLIRTVPTPTNIALYGAWGSGKSGIANLLRERVTRLQGVKFARFDAFKYAENPLRRNFVAAVAGSLGINDKKFHDELYNGKVTNDFQLPFIGLCKLLLVFAGVAGGAVAISLAIMALVSLFGEASFEEVFQKNISSLFAASLVPASIMTVLFAIVGKVLVVERRSEKLASDEQFEAIFRQLVSNARLEKLVIFVDELDRCSPDNVVATLDAVRTFLGVEKCIFIVASDQQVLEKALTKSVQQATPLDKFNPYYSAGSAYLDKVFQYHISVPPLLPHSVTRYAMELVDGRAGIWAKVNVAQIVSILVPSHVKSPRRVKNLLNSFALFYRLAESRRKAGFLQADLVRRVEEMAKLVCLNVEFPLFARDLLVDHKLPEYVLALFELGSPGEYALSEEDSGEEGFNEAVFKYWQDQKYVSQAVKDLAKEYALSNASSAPLMISSGSDKAREVERSQARQLIDYLSRTRRVASPQKDFIHLQSAGNLFGLSGEAASELELHAQNGSWQKVLAIYEKLDSVGRRGALLFLLQQGRVAIGLEQENIVSCILSIVSDESVDISVEADQLFDMVEISVSKSHALLNPATMKGAWRLSIVSSRAAAESFGHKILSYEELPHSLELVVYILESSANALVTSPAEIAEVFVYNLASGDAQELMDAIGGIDDERMVEVLSAISTRLAPSLKKMAADYKAAAELALKAKVDINPDVVSPESAINALVGALLSAKSQELKEEWLNLILSVNHEDFRAGLEPELSRIGVFSQARTIRQILRAAQKRIYSACAEWVSLIDSSSISTADAAKLYADLLTAIIDKASHLTDTKRASAIKSLLNIWDDLSESYQAVLHETVSELKIAVKEDGDIVNAESSIDVMKELIQAGVLNEKILASILAEMVADSLVEEVPAREADNKVLRFILHQAERLLKSCRLQGGEGFSLTEDEQQRIVRLLHGCAWIPESIRIVALIKCLSLVSDGVRDTFSDQIPSYEELSSIVDSQGIELEKVLPAWITISGTSAADLLGPITYGLQNFGFDSLKDAISRWRSKVELTEQQALFKGIVNNPSSVPLNRQALTVLGCEVLDEDFVAGSIIDRYSVSTTRQQRIDVLKLWAAMGGLGGRTKRELIEKVYIPCLQDGGSATKEAIEAFNSLCKPVPRPIKQRLGELIVSNGEKIGLDQKHIYDVLRQANYKVKKRLFSKPVLEND